MTKPIHVFESPHAALIKSAASAVIAAERGSYAGGMAIHSDHPLMIGIDRYAAALVDGKTPPEPDPSATLDENDPDVVAYLAYLHHRKAHATIAGDPQLEADLAAQLGRFKYGNARWQQMFVQYFEYYWQYPYHQGQAPQYRSWKDDAFGKGSLDYGVVQWRLPADATIAVIGDIGTGVDVGAAVLMAALSFRPHAFLHVGDVYYSGTALEFAHRYVGLFDAVFRDQGVRVPVFGVPGNHEYFTGGVSMLENLDAMRLCVTPEQRQRASYFSVRTEDDGWQFLGMDTGYHGHYMDVPAAAQQAALQQLHLGKVSAPKGGDPEWSTGDNPHFRDTTHDEGMVFLRADEAQWHTHQARTFKGRSVLLSHHQLYSSKQKLGVAQRQVGGAPDPADLNRAWVNTRLWQQLGPLFGDHVAAWIWGHEHNLGIYQSGYRPQGWPAPDDVYKTLPKGRCAGHSAIPVAAHETPYEPAFPVPPERKGLELALRNGWYDRGFEIIALGGAGRPATVTYYQVDGADPTPIEIYEETFE